MWQLQEKQKLQLYHEEEEEEIKLEEGLLEEVVELQGVAVVVEDPPKAEHPEHRGEEVKVLEVDQDRVLEEEVEVVASVVEEDEVEEEVGEVEEEVEGIGIQ